LSTMTSPFFFPFPGLRLPPCQMTLFPSFVNALGLLLFPFFSGCKGRLLEPGFFVFPLPYRKTNLLLHPWFGSPCRGWRFLFCFFSVLSPSRLSTSLFAPFLKTLLSLTSVSRSSANPFFVLCTTPKGRQDFFSAPPPLSPSYQFAGRPQSQPPSILPLNFSFPSFCRVLNNFRDLFLTNQTPPLFSQFFFPSLRQAGCGLLPPPPLSPNLPVFVTDPTGRGGPSAFLVSMIVKAQPCPMFFLPLGVFSFPYYSICFQIWPVLDWFAPPTLRYSLDSCSFRSLVVFGNFWTVFCCWSFFRSVFPDIRPGMT